jgi:hypothetical protein
MSSRPDIRETAPYRAAVRGIVEGDARQPDAIKPSFENGRHPVPPSRETQNECFSRSEPFNVGLDSGEIGALFVMHFAFVERQHGLEALGVEVEVIDLMTTCDETIDDLAMNRRGEAIR